MRMEGMVIKMMKGEVCELLQISVGQTTTTRLVTTRQVCV
jgi:hypothetical protein